MRLSTPSNAAGDFYVAKDECIACGAPEAEAPDLMAFDEAARSCFFVRQPTDADELEQALGAIRVSCCGAVRYRGSAPDVQERIAASGGLSAIDVPLEHLARRYSNARR